MLAWHFTNGTLRDGDPIPPIGETLRYDGPLVMCESGLHASVRSLDALSYAPGATVHRVRCGGEIIKGRDKLVCRERTIVWSADATETLRHFARLCALDVIHLWEASDVVVQYLRTGDKSLSADAARAAAATYAAAAATYAATYAATAAYAAAYVATAAYAAAADAAAYATAAYAARAAADAARAAARAKQDRRLVRMLGKLQPVL